MPGPSNGRKRHQKKKKKSAFFLATTTTQSNEPKLNAHGIDGARAEATHSLRPSQENNQEQQHSQRIVKPNDGVERLWNGPRVIDVVAFLESSYAARPSFDDRDCAEFACEEMKRIFSQLLPEDTGLVSTEQIPFGKCHVLTRFQMLWYNTSRKRARICPACRRFYNLGDKLAPHVLGSNPLEAEHEQDPRNEREQEISGICASLHT